MLRDISATFDQSKLHEFYDDDATLLEKKSQGLSHNHIQPSETLPQELMKNSSDKEYSSESKRNELDISLNAKRKHDDDSQSNCKEPIKKMCCENSATFDQSKLHDPFQNHSFDKTNEESEAVNKIYDNFVKCLDRALPSQMEEF
ncbi:hypothetical protein TNCV_2417521 [Trichonephila clavipes]|nr:hypothetical protein TNCV_2417521 [Trichonephila clavipes]